jgi:ribosome maturation factor RimP
VAPVRTACPSRSRSPPSGGRNACTGAPVEVKLKRAAGKFPTVTARLEAFENEQCVFERDFAERIGHRIPVRHIAWVSS